MSTNPVFGLCKKIMAVREEDLADLEEMARGQTEYISPLKLATQGRTNTMGDYNLRVLAKLRELRGVLLAGPQSVAASPCGDVPAILRIYQSTLGNSREQCDDNGKRMWDRIEAALQHPEGLSDDDLRELAYSAHEEAMSFGLSHETFLRYFKTIRGRATAGVPSGCIASDGTRNEHKEKTK